MENKLHKLDSVAVWVDEDEKTIYPCDENGNLLRENGILLYELNQNWYNYLDREDKEYLSNLVNNKNN